MIVPLRYTSTSELIVRAILLRLYPPCRIETRQRKTLQKAASLVNVVCQIRSLELGCRALYYKTADSGPAERKSLQGAHLRRTRYSINLQNVWRDISGNEIAAAQINMKVLYQKASKCRRRRSTTFTYTKRGPKYDSRLQWRKCLIYPRYLLVRPHVLKNEMFTSLNDPYNLKNKVNVSPLCRTTISRVYTVLDFSAYYVRYPLPNSNSFPISQSMNQLWSCLLSQVRCHLNSPELRTAYNLSFLTPIWIPRDATKLSTVIDRRTALMLLRLKISKYALDYQNNRDA